MNLFLGDETYWYSWIFILVVVLEINVLIVVFLLESSVFVPVFLDIIVLFVCLLLENTVFLDKFLVLGGGKHF